MINTCPENETKVGSPKGRKGDPLSIVGIAIAIGIAVWQNRKTARAETALNTALSSIPDKIVGSVKTILVADYSPKKKPPDSSAEVKPSLSEGLPVGVEYVDIDGDGRKEMLVQYPAGAHGSQLKIFAWRQSEFSEIGHLGVGTPVGFDIGDFDGDGKLEIRTEETDWSAGLPYVTAPRITLLYRWNGSAFEEVSPKKLDLKDA